MAKWLEEEDEKLKKLCAQGLVFRDIGARIGRCKNSCISRARRLGVSNGHPSNCRSSTKISTKVLAVLKESDCGAATLDGKRAKRIAAKNLPDIAVAVAVKSVESLEPVTFLEREEQQCCWPLGDPRESSFRMCGNTLKTHSRYCDGHVKIGIQKRRVPKTIVEGRRDHRASSSPALSGWH